MISPKRFFVDSLVAVVWYLDLDCSMRTGEVQDCPTSRIELSHPTSRHRWTHRYEERIDRDSTACRQPVDEAALIWCSLLVAAGEVQRNEKSAKEKVSD